MCKATADGGRRCASHTRAALTAATTRLTLNPTPTTRQALDEAYAQHAATRSGRREIADLYDAALDTADDDRIAALRTAIRRGTAIRAGFDAAEQAVRAEKAAAAAGKPAPTHLVSVSARKVRFRRFDPDPAVVAAATERATRAGWQLVEAGIPDAPENEDDAVSWVTMSEPVGTRVFHTNSSEQVARIVTTRREKGLAAVYRPE